MEKDASPTLVTTKPAATCTECGTTSHNRQYVRILNHHTCEHCFLESRKCLCNLGNDTYELFVESLAEALDLRERETGLHSKRVAIHTLLLAAHHYKNASDLREVYWGSLLHDIGKIGVPDAVLLKPGQLSDKEWLIMREHPRNGHHILQKLPFLGMAANIVLCHEERSMAQATLMGLRARISLWQQGSSLLSTPSMP